MATANIKGVQIQGTPQEIKEFYELMYGKDRENQSTYINPEEYWDEKMKERLEERLKDMEY